MSNPYLFGAFALVAAVFFIHGWIMSARQARLEKKLEELKAQMKGEWGEMRSPLPPGEGKTAKR
jgi:hypothetical protein